MINRKLQQDTVEAMDPAEREELLDALKVCIYTDPFMCSILLYLSVLMYVSSTSATTAAVSLLVVQVLRRTPFTCVSMLRIYGIGIAA
jgi:hypothetical protein